MGSHLPRPLERESALGRSQNRGHARLALVFPAMATRHGLETCDTPDHQGCSHVDRIRLFPARCLDGILTGRRSGRTLNISNMSVWHQYGKARCRTCCRAGSYIGMWSSVQLDTKAAGCFAIHQFAHIENDVFPGLITVDNGHDLSVYFCLALF